MAGTLSGNFDADESYGETVSNGTCHPQQVEAVAPVTLTTHPHPADIRFPGTFLLQHENGPCVSVLVGGVAGEGEVRKGE